MNKIVSFFKRDIIMKNSTASAAHTVGPDTSPHPLLVSASSSLVTEAVKVCRQEKKERVFVEVRATLAPRLGYNLVTCAKIKWLGRENEIEGLEPSDSFPIIANEAALRPTGCIELGVIFHEAGNMTKTWFEMFFVVERLWADMELMLGGTMCERAKIAAGVRLCPFRIRDTSEGNGFPPCHSTQFHAFQLLTCIPIQRRGGKLKLTFRKLGGGRRREWSPKRTSS